MIWQMIINDESRCLLCLPTVWYIIFYVGTSLSQVTHKDQLMYCVYYQAHVKRSDCWFLTAVLRSFEHMAFDRTLDVENSLFEFFVAPQAERYFLEVMLFFEQKGIVTNCVRLPNRLSDPMAQL
jgi:hypothetical protein